MSAQLLLCVAFLLVAKETAADCKKITSCSCQMDDGKVIDLSPLAGQGQPTFRDIPEGNYFYSYNPCNDFSDVEEDCLNVAVCQKSLDASFLYDLGDQSTADFTTTDDVVTLHYTGQGTVYPDTRKSHVILKCTPSGSGDNLEVQGELVTQEYDFTLSSPHCCPQDSGHGGGGGISIGTILCIIVISVVLVYVIGGILILKFVKHEEGTDVIPNKGFWTELPVLVKDGVLYASSPCRKSSPYTSM